MNANVLGFECSLYNGNIDKILMFLSGLTYKYYVSNYLLIDSKEVLLPKKHNDFWIKPNTLESMAKETIWELVLFVYDKNVIEQPIKTYDDYVNSSCVACLLYYDCGLLEIYVKEPHLRNRLLELLIKIGAEDLKHITDDCNYRVFLYP